MNKLIVLVLILTSCTSDFKVAPEKDETWSFVVFSDPQQGYGVLRQLVVNICKLQPSPLIAFCCGDIMLHSDNEAEWESFNNSTESIRQKMPLLIARGNHEGNDSVSEAVLHDRGLIASDHFYFNYTEKNAFFIVLDTYERGSEGAIRGDQLKWLNLQLDSASADTSVHHIFILMHQPLYPQGKHMGQDLGNANELHRLFLSHPKIHAVFSGHDHMFNKYYRDGLIYITTGGGGGDLYSGYGGDYHHFLKVSFFIDQERLNIKTIDTFNEIIDEFDL